jgi:RNA polymerase sigma factor (sigma-70 family)
MEEERRAPRRLSQVVYLPAIISSLPAPADDGAEIEPPIELPATTSKREQGPSLTAGREKLMIEHLPMVRFMARRMHERLPQEVSIEDLYSAGVVGLIQAFAKFDPSKQVLFRTYAYFQIRGAILDRLRVVDWSPRELRCKGRAIEQAVQKLTAQFVRPPSELEVAEELQMGLEAYKQLLDDLGGLEIGTLYTGRWEDSREEELASPPNPARHDLLLLRRDDHEGNRAEPECNRGPGISDARFDRPPSSREAGRFRHLPVKREVGPVRWLGKRSLLPKDPIFDARLTSRSALVVADRRTVLVGLRLLLDIDARLRKHIGRRGELVTLIVLILNTIDMKTVPVLELRSDLKELVATTVKLPAALHASLKFVASSRQSSMNALVNSAIWVYTEERSKKG